MLSQRLPFQLRLHAGQKLASEVALLAGEPWAVGSVVVALVDVSCSAANQGLAAAMKVAATPMIHVCEVRPAVCHSLTLHPTSQYCLTHVHRFRRAV